MEALSQPPDLRLRARPEMVNSVARGQQQYSGAVPRKSRMDFGFVFLWLLTFVIYGRPEDLFSVVAPLHLTFVFAACATAICGCALMLRKTHLPWTIETKLVALLTAWFLLGIPFAFWKSGSLDVLTHVWAKTVLVYLLLTL